MQVDLLHLSSTIHRVMGRVGSIAGICRCVLALPASAFVLSILIKSCVGSRAASSSLNQTFICNSCITLGRAVAVKDCSIHGL